MSAPKDYKLSEMEELGPLVRDFHELIERDITNEEIIALDFALEWVTAVRESEYYDRLKPEYGVTYGVLPQIRTMTVPTLDIAKKIAEALRGQVRVRHQTSWELYKGE